MRKSSLLLVMVLVNCGDGTTTVDAAAPASESQARASLATVLDTFGGCFDTIGRFDNLAGAQSGSVPLACENPCDSGRVRGNGTFNYGTSSFYDVGFESCGRGEQRVTGELALTERPVETIAALGGRKIFTGELVFGSGTGATTCTVDLTFTHLLSKADGSSSLEARGTFCGFAVDATWDAGTYALR